MTPRMVDRIVSGFFGFMLGVLVCVAPNVIFSHPITPEEAAAVLNRGDVPEVGFFSRQEGDRYYKYVLRKVEIAQPISKTISE